MGADNRHPLVRLIVIFAAVLCCFVTSLGSAPVAAAADAPGLHLGYGPGDGKARPPDFSDQGGVDKQSHYCDYGKIRDDNVCRLPEAGEFPRTIGECENPDGSASSDCSDQQVREVEKKKELVEKDPTAEVTVDLEAREVAPRASPPPSSWTRTPAGGS